MDIVMNEIFEMDIVSLPETLVRLSLAMLFGFALGWERESKDKPIDYRAYMIVGLTTCMVAIMGQELYQDYRTAENFINLDLGKIIAGTLTGIGFLGAGAIIKREGTNVVGTATGASIWAAGGMGLTLGFGYYGLALIVFAFVIMILFWGGILSKKITGNDHS